MIRLKNKKQLEGIQTSCKLLSQTYKHIIPEVKPGVKTSSIDTITREYIQNLGAAPSFLGYLGFPSSICISINEEVIHGIPGERIIQEGDIVSLDLGIEYNGYYSDAAVTLAAGNISSDARHLMDITKECLERAIKASLAGNRIKHISMAVEEHAIKHDYGIVYQYCGHGVGLHQHEEPQIPNYVSSGANPRIKNGMVFAIEPMINIGTDDVHVLDDDWTVVTDDSSLSAHFEHTVAIIDGKPQVLTNFEN